ncbi:unnamed protein product, partial [Rangifer tarandus platyrhynchus]
VPPVLPAPCSPSQAVPATPKYQESPCPPSLLLAFASCTCSPKGPGTPPALPAPCSPSQTVPAPPKHQGSPLPSQPLLTLITCTCSPKAPGAPPCPSSPCSPSQAVPALPKYQGPPVLPGPALCLALPLRSAPAQSGPTATARGPALGPTPAPRACPGAFTALGSSPFPASSHQSLLPSQLVVPPTQPRPPEHLVMRSPPRLSPSP